MTNTTNNTDSAAKNSVTLDRRDLWDYVRGAIHAALHDKIPKDCVVSWAWEEATNRTMDIFQKIVDTASSTPPAADSAPLAGVPVAWMLQESDSSKRWYTSGQQAMEHWVSKGATATPLFAAPASAQPPVALTDPEGFDAKRLIQRHANAARALEHIYTEKNIERLKSIGEELEEALAKQPPVAVLTDQESLLSAATICDQLAERFPQGAADICAKTLRTMAKQLDSLETRQ